MKVNTKILAITAAFVGSVAMANAVMITQSASQTIVAGSVSCNAGGITSDNGYSRGFTLAAHGITQPFAVTNVQFGVEQATAGASGGGVQNVTVRIYNGWTVSGTTLTYGSLLASANTSVANGSNFIHTAAISGTCTSGLLGVEIFVADATATGNNQGNSFFIGSNALGQTGLGYIRSAGCGLPNNTSLGSIGFPNMHMIINVNGNVVPEPASMAALGLGAVALIRRRRSK